MLYLTKLSFFETPCSIWRVPFNLSCSLFCFDFLVWKSAIRRTCGGAEEWLLASSPVPSLTRYLPIPVASSLPFSLPRYFFTDPSFLFFLLLSPAIFPLLLSPLLFLVHLSAIAILQLVLTKPKLASIQILRVYNEWNPSPLSKSKHFSQNRTFIQRLFFKTSTYSTLVHCSKHGQYVVC